MWLYLAIFSAVLLGVRRIYEKELTAHFGNFSLSFVFLASSVVPILLLFPFFALPADIWHLPANFWWPLSIIWLVLYPLQNYFLYRSIREGEISEVTPVSSLLPVFNVGTSLVLLGEVPTPLGLVGIIVTVFATYLLLTDTGGSRRFLNMPVLFMVCTVLCTAIGSSLDKIAIEASTPIFYSFINTLGASVVFFILMYVYGEQRDLRHVPAFAWKIILLGIVLALAFAAFIAAFSVGPTSYVLAVRSLGYMVPVVWGIVVLRESLSRRKLFALGLFVIGTLGLALG